jgi:hypothetical protein
LFVTLSAIPVGVILFLPLLLAGVQPGFSVAI